MCLLLETIKIVEGKPQNLEFHQQRMELSREKLFGRNEKPDLEKILNESELTTEGIYKCRLIYGQKVEKTEFIPYEIKPVRSLKIVHADDLDYSLKYADRTEINKLREKRGGCDDILIIKNGFVTDTSYANIIFWDGEKWLTPSTPLLKGTKRQKLIDEGKIIPAEIREEDIPKFKKAKIINSMIDIEDTEGMEIDEIY